MGGAGIDRNGARQICRGSKYELDHFSEKRTGDWRMVLGTSGLTSAAAPIRRFGLEEQLIWDAAKSILTKI